MSISPSQAPDSMVDNQNLASWHKGLWPWVTGIIVALLILFSYMATSQLFNVNSQINTYKTSELDKIFINRIDSKLIIPEGQDVGEFTKLYMLAKMEEQLMNKHYSQGGVLLTARLYIQYLGFFTGMILAIVGAIFIISKLKEGESFLLASNKTAAISFSSTSPGIIFGVLGTIMMLSTILSHNEISIKDSAVYLNAEMINPGMAVQEASPAKTSTNERMRDSFPPPDI